jgi:hypothetical protein
MPNGMFVMFKTFTISMDRVHDGLSILTNFMIDVTTCMLM